MYAACVQGSGRLLHLTVDPDCRALPAYLASLGGHASCERLRLRAYEGGLISLQPSAALLALPRLHRLQLDIDREGTHITVALPMPALEELLIPEVPEMFAPFVAMRVAVGSPAASAGTGAGRQPQLQPAFPSLRRLRVVARVLKLEPAAVPVLQQLRVRLFHPGAALVPLAHSSLGALTSLVRHGHDGSCTCYGACTCRGACTCSTACCADGVGGEALP